MILLALKFADFPCFYSWEGSRFRMRVKINGKKEEVREKTILDLLTARKIQPQLVCVEVNSKVLEREAYGKAVLQEGDEIEFVYYMGGGA